jgi:hypothetical protein
VATKQWRPWALFGLGHRLSGATATPVGVEEQILQVAGGLGPDSNRGFRECSSVACCLLRRAKPVGSRSFGAQSPTRVLEVQFSATASGGTGPAGLCLLLPLEQQEPWDLVIQVCQFPWYFRVKVADHVLGEHVALVSCMCREVGLTAE